MKVATFIMIVLVGLTAVACTLPAISQLDLIVSTAEAVIPFIPGIPPAYVSKGEAYVDGILKTADDLLGQEITTVTLAKAIGDFNTYTVPQIGDAKIQNLLNAVDKSVQTFLTNYAGTVVQATYVGTDRNSYDAAIQASYIRTLVPAKKTIRLSTKDKARLAAIHDRVKAARAKLKKQRAALDGSNNWARGYKEDDGLENKNNKMYTHCYSYSPTAVTCVLEPAVVERIRF